MYEIECAQQEQLICCGQQNFRLVFSSNKYALKISCRACGKLLWYGKDNPTIW